MIGGRRWLLASAFVSMGAPQAAAQADVAPCVYETCALSIAPRWNGLAVVRGREEAQLANLNFFLPRDVSVAFRMEGATLQPAITDARRAVRIRKTAALLTDAGAVLVAAGAVRALSDRRLDDASGMSFGAGALSFAISVPLQFAADAALSRAVWLYNRQFAR